MTFLLWALSTVPLQWNKSKDYDANGTLWNYGDSLMLYFHKSILEIPLCNKLFRQCNVTYGYVYRFDLVSPEMSSWDFQQDLVISGIRGVLSRPDVNTTDSVFILNLGHHFAKTVNFSTYQKVVQGVISLLSETTINPNGETVPKYLSRFIWKTSTAIHKERGNYNQASAFRFFTYPVRTKR